MMTEQVRMLLSHLFVPIQVVILPYKLRKTPSQSLLLLMTAQSILHLE